MQFLLSALVSAALPCAALFQPIIHDDGGASQAADRRLKVAIVLYPGVELLDFAGPTEVFSSASGKQGPAFEVFTVAESAAPLTSLDVVTITPRFTLETCPKPDIVVVPGGNVPTESVKLVTWVRACSKDAKLMMSVCNGALLYAKAGLLEGLEVTSHRSALQSLALLEPSAKVFTNRRFVDNGRVLTSAGVAAGIDGALHVVERYFGAESAWKTARYMEYDWRPDEIARLHAQPGTPAEGSDGLRLVKSVRGLGLAGAMAEYKKLEKPPTEAQLNSWGYTLMRGDKLDEGLDLLRLCAALFPASANAADSLSEALERKGDAPAALASAKDCLARLQADEAATGERGALLRNSANSRVARLSGTPKKQLRFVCPPCGSDCDTLAFLEAGACPGCHMQLTESGQFVHD